MKKLKLLALILLCGGMLYLPTTIVNAAEENEPGTTEPEVKKYTVTFNTDGGSKIDPITVEEGKTAVKPADPTKNGYIFKGWYLGKITYDFTEKVTKDITLTANWEKEVEKTKGYLSSLSIDGLKLDFTSTKTDYKITVPADTKTIKIVAEADANSEVLIPGGATKTLKDGDNTFTVIAKSKNGGNEDQYNTTYTIVVTREVPDVTLESLKISGFVFKEAFDPNVYEYTVEVPYDTTEVNVIAKAKNSNASVSVDGGKDLVVGDNTITVTVTYATGTKQSYTITVTRLEEEETETVTSDNVTSEDNVVPPVTDKKDNNDVLKYVLIAVECILILGLVALGVFFYLKTTSPEKKQAKLEKKKQKEFAKQKKKTEVVEEVIEPESNDVEELGEEVLEEDLEPTIEAPAVDHSDILDGIDDLFSDDKKGE